MTWSPDDVTSTVFATLTFTSIVGAALIAVFEYVRGYYTDIYLPRLRCQAHRTLDRPPRGPFIWIKHILNISDEDFYRSVGLDGYVLLRYTRLCCKMACISAVLGLIILAPVYFSCPGNDGVAGINLYTMANVEQNGSKLWAPFFLTWAFTLVLLYLLHTEYGVISVLRQEFLEHGDPLHLRPQTRYSVLVENIPVEYRSTEKLAEFFNNLFPGEVAHACISVGMGPLAMAIKKRDEAVANAEIAVAAREASEAKERPLLRLYKGIPVHSACTCGSVTEVDALEYYEKEITTLNARISRFQIEARNAENDDVLPPGTIISDDDINCEDEDISNSVLDLNFMGGKKTISKKSVSGTGFLTFKSRRAQASACQVAILSQKYPQLKVFPAPDPDDVIWENVTTPKDYIDETSNVVAIVYYVGIFFWGAILAFVATISNLESLSEYLPFIDDINPTLYSIVAGILPVYALVLLMYLIPIIMEWIGEYIEKQKTRSSIGFDVFSWNFTYQLTNVYFLMVAGSVATAIADLIDDPSSLLNTLGAALPAVSVLFINYALNVTLIQIPADMLRAPAIFLFIFYRRIFTEKKLTRRQLIEGPLAEEPVDYGVVIPKLLYLMVLVVTYWTIAPFLLGVLTFAFGGQYLRFKYKLLYIHVPKYESGGFFWYGLYKYTMYALVASTVTMIAYMGIKEGPAQGALLFPLLYVVYRAWNYTEKCYKDSSMFVAYSSAVEADCSKYATSDASQALLQTFHADYYKQPYFSAPQVAHLQPYRVDGSSLFTVNGNLASVYYREIPHQDVEDTNVVQPQDLGNAALVGVTSTGTSMSYLPPTHVANTTTKNPMSSEESNFSGSNFAIDGENL